MFFLWFWIIWFLVVSLSDVPLKVGPPRCVCREIRNVELLKLRFGESHMHYCEVMLKVNAVRRHV